MTTTNQKHVKIIATLGPNSRDPEVVANLIKAGANCFRLNFSHGSHEEHLSVLKTVRTVAADMGACVAVLQDLSGPKIRISPVEGDFTQIEDNTTIDLAFADGKLSDGTCLRVEGVDPTKALEEGHMALLADGMIAIRAESFKRGAGGDRVTCRVVKGGRVRSRVGIAFPESNLTLPATTEKDLKDLSWGIKNGVDFVAVSFVQDANDIEFLRGEIAKQNGNIKIIAKIERRKALEAIDEIVKASDGVMVARGDLGLEVPLERLPRLQKHLIEHCNHRGIPVIVATQMLHSMVTSIRPTRAEVSDVATAIMTGADVLMLSDETAIGNNPPNCVEYLAKIAAESEKGFEFDEYKLRLRESDRESVPDALAYAACAAALKVQAHAIVACTETGTTARLVAKYRPQQPLFGVSPNPETLRRMSLYWGVQPVAIPSTAVQHEDELKLAIDAVVKAGNLKPGNRIVILGGLSASMPGSTSVLKVVEVQ